MLRRLGEKNVLAIGLGCMGMSEFYGSVDEKEALKVLFSSFEIGYRHYDTADMYGSGHNELLLGNFLHEMKAKRSDMLISTKTGIVRDPNNKFAISLNGKKSYIKKSCEDSLRRLRTDYIDLYYLHRVDPKTPVEESMDALKELVQEGKVHSVGLCEVNIDTLNRANAAFKISAVQNEYSLWSRDIEDGLLSQCHSLGISVVAFSPLGRGFLTGKIDKEFLKNAEKNNDFRLQIPRFKEENLDKNLLLAEQMKSIADKTSVPPSQLALYWLLKQHPNLHAIPGTTSIANLKSNFNSMDINIEEKYINQLSDIFLKENVFGLRYPEKIINISKS